MAKEDCTCKENGNCGCNDTGGVQIIKNLNEIKSPVFNFTTSEVRRILFCAEIIKTHFQHSGITYNFGYVEKDHVCPPCRIKKAKKIHENGRSFRVFFQRTPSGIANGICTIYRAE